ncbi:MAG: HD domain-containing protein [Candidatus Aenigmatarchaeota archaeon]
MKRLFELAEMIRDKDLRERTLKLLKNPESKSPTLKGYGPSELSKMPVWVGAHHDYDGGFVDHTVGVTELCLSMAKSFEKVYGREMGKAAKGGVNYDHLIAGALLHDIGKVFIIKKADKEKQKLGMKWDFSGLMIDHAVLSANLLHEHGFPEEVVHMVASHGGDMGAASASPKTIEAWLLVQADNLDAQFESSVLHPSLNLQQLQFLLNPQAESERK